MILNTNDFISAKDEEQLDETSLLLVDKVACAKMQRSEHGKLRKCANSSVWLKKSSCGWKQGHGKLAAKAGR